MYVSGKLPTYPCPNLTFCPKRELSVNVRFGEGQVGSFPETYIDPQELCFSVTVSGRRSGLIHWPPARSSCLGLSPGQGRALRCVLGQDTLLSQCLSSPRSINGCQQTVGAAISSRESSKYTPTCFMLQKLELQALVAQRLYMTVGSQFCLVQL